MKYCVILFSFGDGVQYPVQIKHFPGNIGHTSNYESMGNSYSLNKFEENRTHESNDLRKNLLPNQNAAYADTNIQFTPPTTTMTTTSISTIPTTTTTASRDHIVNNHYVDGQLPAIAVINPANDEFTIVNETSKK